MNFDFGEVFARAWQITWKHKVLWVFNTLPVLLSFLFLPFVFVPMLFMEPNSLVDQSFLDEPALVSLFIGANIILSILSIILYAVAVSSVSLGVLRVEEGIEQLSFRDLLQGGYTYFGRVLGVMLLIGFGVLIVFLALFACMMVFGMLTMGLGMICVQPLFLLMYPAIMVVYALTEQSEAAVVADNLGVMDAISRGWDLIKANFWKFVLIALVIYFGMSILGSIVMLPFMVPFFFLPFFMENSSQMELNIRTIGLIAAAFSILFIPVMAIVQGFSLTFMKSGFMIVYLRLTRSPAKRPELQEAAT